MAKAEQLVREALKASPESAAYLDSLGWVLYKEGKFDEAVRTLLDATKAAPELDAVLWDHLGDAYWRLSRQEDAKKAWEAAVKILGDRGEGKAGDLKRVREKVENVQAGKAPAVAPLAPKDEPAPNDAKGASAR
ncbi:MAG: hypothetical protein NT049_07475 [Planctomycetota bacterium]|nr:hypothetical protein [Planctomycetota bacterium]